MIAIWITNAIDGLKSSNIPVGSQEIVTEQNSRMVSETLDNLITE